MKYLMNSKTKNQQSIKNNIRYRSFPQRRTPLLYPFFGKSQAWMKYNPTLTKKEFQCIMVTMNKKTKTQKEHYVNNKEFLAAMIDYKKSNKEAEKKKKPRNPRKIRCFDRIPQIAFWIMSNWTLQYPKGGLRDPKSRPNIQNAI